MTEPRRTHRPADGRHRTRVPRPLNSAGRPVDGSGRPVGGAPQDAEGESAEPRPQGEAHTGAGGPADEWERIRSTFGQDHGAARSSSAGDPPTLGSLLLLLEALRGMVPRELERQFTALLREVLLTLRALIDRYLERLDGGGDERRVEDIPIE